MKNRGGQVAIFVIVAIVIVAVVVVFFLFPQANVFVGGQEVNPSSFLRGCIEPAVDEISEVIYAQGGYSNPDHYVTYQGTNIQYLCYTGNDYEPCRIAQPLLVEHVEGEIKDYVQPRARECVNDLVERYESQGFDVSSTPGEVEVDYSVNGLNVDFLSPMTISKEGETQNFERFGVAVESKMYDLLLIATSILQFESSLGDSESTLYIQYYPDLKPEKIKRGEDTIYILSDVATGESFTFATRSLVWPEGYGLEQL